MYNYRMYSSDDSPDTSSCDSYHIYNNNWDYPSPYFRCVPYTKLFDDTKFSSRFDSSQLEMDNNKMVLKDYGPKPLVINIDKATKQNNNFRTGLWTGDHFQVTLMSINVGDDIGLEIHPDTDQFIRIEHGQAVVKMGRSKENLDFQVNAHNDFAIMIPAGMWHNVINTGDKPLKVYAIYAPPQHPHDVVNVTKPAE
ncbi:cupin domain-containing protein [Clostridium uliginosum]|uniref:Mannose-6-phosphate isomerase, cupin superfamily n=1 Tax=Clostridium uliginosum TaxID=119641 RepID=A0A1I1QSL3_9CLOT|nr:cupin domain-containing protein [Clostridium uliginosum]SFD25002.1 Mannose-6-phosphate isomerase, cupin superfamily [Clostridium uliginosum]